MLMVEPGLVLEAGPALSSDVVPLLCLPPKLSGPPLDSMYPVDTGWLLGLLALKVMRPPVELWLALVELRVMWPIVELGSPKVTWPILELVAWPPVDIRMPLVLWLMMDPGIILGLLGITRGVPEPAFWVLERDMLKLLSIFFAISINSFRCCSRDCSRASICGGAGLGPIGQLRSCPAQAAPVLTDFIT